MLLKFPDKGTENLTETQNGYSYAINNPNTFTDADGRNPLIVVLVVRGGIVVAKYYIKKDAKKKLKKKAKKVVLKKNKGIGNVSFNQGSLKHIFRKAPGHLADTPANRKLLLNTASNKKNI